MVTCLCCRYLYQFELYENKTKSGSKEGGALTRHSKPLPPSSDEDPDSGQDQSNQQDKARPPDKAKRQDKQKQ